MAHHLRAPEMTLLRPDRNLGAVGRDIAVRHARTPYIPFCDDDTWWQPGSLRRAADLLDARPRLAALTARTMIGPDGTGDPVLRELRERGEPHRPPPGRPAARQHGPPRPRHPRHPVVHLAAPPPATGAPPHWTSDAHRAPGLASARAFARATAGLPWVLRQHDPVSPDLERRPAALERARRTSPARRCVG
ncbi:glycosyltransferase [Streptomyces sp. RB17]|uniref:glycosyltransferase n=1 Tax=Streptomyces sp. RB17 TaxID=2585197 RepID=UPI003A4C783E